MNIATREKIFRTLKQLDLSSLEIQIYLGLLQAGNIAASGLARKLNLNRSTVRYTLENLKKKRLALQSEKNGTFYFMAESPERIVAILEDEQAVIAKKQYAVSKIVNDLKSLQNPHASMPKVQFFEGVDGLINMYEDMLTTSQETQQDVYGYSKISVDDMPTALWEFLRKKYLPARADIGNAGYMIWNQDMQQSDYLKNDTEINRTSLFVPIEKFPLETGMQIYGHDKIAFYSREDMTGVIIQNPYIARGQLSLFKLAWNHALTLLENQTHQHKIF